MRRQRGRSIQAVKSTINPVPGVLAAPEFARAVDLLVGSIGSCAANSFFGSNGSFGLSFVAKSACGDWLAKDCASGELELHEQLLMNTSRCAAMTMHARVKTNR
jgi:hypothetical protein